MPKSRRYKKRNIPTKQPTTTKKGKRQYMQKYMAIRRAELFGKGANEICQVDIQASLGIDLSKLGRVQRPAKKKSR